MDKIEMAVVDLRSLVKAADLAMRSVADVDDRAFRRVCGELFARIVFDIHDKVVPFLREPYPALDLTGLADPSET